MNFSIQHLRATGISRDGCPWCVRMYVRAVLDERRLGLLANNRQQQQETIPIVVRKNIRTAGFATGRPAIKSGPEPKISNKALPRALGQGDMVKPTNSPAPLSLHRTMQYHVRSRGHSLCCGPYNVTPLLWTVQRHTMCEVWIEFELDKHNLSDGALWESVVASRLS